ncbi:MAG: HlyD family secretion protein [Reyranella sp.]
MTTARATTARRPRSPPPRRRSRRPTPPSERPNPRSSAPRRPTKRLSPRSTASRADIDDSALKAPRDGRVQYRVAQPGEVLAAGGRVLNMVDLFDVYMTFFLPTEAAGRIAIGSEVRLVLDTAPQFVFPARVTFVADVAQFTPKSVETAIERLKLMFRIKANVDPALLNRHLDQVKTGLPGVAYVRTDPKADWPANLTVKLPP